MNLFTKVSRPLIRKNYTEKSIRYLSGTKKLNDAHKLSDEADKQPKSPKHANDNRIILKIAGFAGIMLTVGYFVRKMRRQSVITQEQIQHRKDIGALVRSNSSKPEELQTNKTPREQYNFINTVVKKCAPAVFFLEIRDPNKKDIDGKPLITSNGSGFIISEDGWALTNAHVILNKTHSLINAILRDGNNYPVTVEDVDMNIDLALLKLDTKQKVPSLKFGESDTAVGEWVVALGSPLSLSNSVTVGIISCVNRPAQDLGLKNYSMSYIQTDAAITFGNSGGPLVNLDGNVIGINNLRLTSGISFAIPVEYAKRFLENTKYKVKEMRYVGAMGKSLFGITTIPITPEVVQELQKTQKKYPANVKEGLLIWKIIPGAAAAKGGLKVGDIITHVNGTPVKCQADLYISVVKNQTIEMELIQQGQKITVFLTPDMFEGNDW